MWRNLMLSAGVFLATLTTTVYAQEMPPAQVSTAILSTKEMAPTIALKGNVVSLQNAQISAQVEGQLLSIARVGTSLKMGQSIASIDKEVLQWSLDVAQANLKSLQADLIFRTSEVTRFTSLAQRDNASQTQLQEATANQQMLQQQIAVAQTRIAQAKRDVKMSDVPAPFSGVITRRHAQQGEYLTVGAPVAQLVDIENIEISVAVPLGYFDLLSEGKRLQVDYQDKLYVLPILSLVAVGDPQTRMAEVRLDATGTDLDVGASVTVHAPRATPETRLAVPQDAFVLSGSRGHVYRVVDGKAELVPVKYLFLEGNTLAVEGDLKEGDEVIIRGGERLQPGAAVMVTNK